MYVGGRDAATAGDIKSEPNIPTSCIVQLSRAVVVSATKAIVSAGEDIVIEGVGLALLEPSGETPFAISDILQRGESEECSNRRS